MSVPAAYLGMVLIWTTTPLAIKWSSEGVGPWLGASVRMQIGLFVCLVLLALLSRRMRWHAAARNTYLVAGLGIWGAMSAVYWGAQYLSSGMVSVVFGLSPLVTGLLAGFVLKERAFTRGRSLGMLAGFAGLTLVFSNSLGLGGESLPGLLGVSLAVLVHALSAVSIKRLNAGLHPVETTVGALLIAVPLFWLAWGISHTALPAQIDMRGLWAMLYLGVVATGLGFVFYYYVLGHVTASGVAVATLITPAMALLLGALLNGEQIHGADLLGTAVILSGLACYQWGDRLLRRQAVAV